ncbi:MAG: hypothetical protein Q9183_002964, partial [Haloplaca sp. 2 TL-2023]
MPQTPTSRRASKHQEKTSPISGSKSVDIGKPLGVYDTNSVRDRVRQWQAQGGGVVTAPDVYIENDENHNKHEASQKASPRPKKTGRASPVTRTSDKDVDGTKPRRGREARQNSGFDEGQVERSRSKSAPSRRVVSDAHWRKDRSPARAAPSPKASKASIDSKSKPADDNDGIRVRPISTPKGTRLSSKVESQKRDGVSSERVERRRATAQSRRHQESRATSPTDDTRSVGDETHQTQDLEGTPTRTSRASVKGRTRPTESSSPAADPSSITGHIGNRGTVNQNKTPPDHASQSGRGSVSERKSSRRSHKGNILSQVFEESRKAFAKSPEIPIETPRVPTIEAWLSGTQDPFIDGDQPDIEDAEPMPSKTERRHRSPDPVPVEDPNKIWETLDSKDRARSGVHASRRRKRIPSSTIFEGNPFPENFDSGSPSHTSPAGSTSTPKLVDLVDHAPDSPTSLTRRGARKSVSSRKRQPVAPSSEKSPHSGNGASTVLSEPTKSPDEAKNSSSPLRPPGLNRRPFPSTGKHRLSTIASVDTLNSRAPPSKMSVVSEAPKVSRLPDSSEAEALEAASGDQFDPDSLTMNKSRLARHADLMSVLSMPDPGNKSIRSARSIRTNRSRLATATIEDLMGELSSDEAKYMRELKTLVDGVIPVLLSCVLSKSDSAVAAGLFRPSYNSSQEDPNFTKPIIDMGIALERLKTLHKRIPMIDAKSLLTWAQGAQRVYGEYLKAWRMGFQDVVVNLAPASDSSIAGEETSTSKGGLDEGLPVNKDGDVVNGDGERVDVAFLLKRPLVRLKYLAKTLKGINIVSPSAEAETLSTKYQNLVTTARNRSNEERARLEDEAAANIDATRARDPRTLAPLTGVSIDRTRRVRARDHFNLALQQSSGQRIDCRVELLLRDEASELPGSGDLLICEVDATGRWLLFPPVQSDRVSARNGDSKGEMVVMIRGLSGTGVEWQEIMSLRSEDEESAFEWAQMLGLTPVPPAISRTQSFLSKRERKKSVPGPISTLDAPDKPSSPAKSRTPSPREVQVPIGEPPSHSTKVWNEPSPKQSEKISSHADEFVTKRKDQRKSRDLATKDVTRSPTTYVDSVNDLRSLPSQSSEKIKREQESMRRPRSFKEALGLTGTSTNSLGLRRSKAQKMPGNDGTLRSPKSPRASKDGADSPRSPSKPSATVREHEEELQRKAPAKESIHETPDSGTGAHEERKGVGQKENRPGYQRSPSSVPSMDLPTMPKIRKESPPTTPVQELEEEPQWATPPESNLPPSPPKHSDQHTRKRLSKTGRNPASASGTPSPDPSRSSSPSELRGAKVPVLTSTAKDLARRRSSSPLKHEYEPSTASDSSDSDTSTVDHNQVSSASSSEDEEELEAGDAPTPLLPFGIQGRAPKRSSAASLYSLPNGTLKPSESASQAPYKKVPAQPTKASKTIASIFSWSDKGSWESLHPDECSIVITPGLIEAFQMSAAHSVGTPLSSSTPVVDVDAFSDMASNIMGPEEVSKDVRPLVALELTPLVPLRRGTAIDISIRSPPTARSQITSGSNIMFRSRNPEECEALYALINHSRIHNPTYIALQNARGPFSGGNDLDRRSSTRAGGSRMSSWFGGLAGSSSYRASSAPTPSIAPSESSIGSMSSAFSALKRFGRSGGGGMFNIARSTISSREGTGSRANSLYTSSDNSSGSGASTPLPPGMQTDPQGTIGLGNTKIRFYVRESLSRWRELGIAYLTIMHPNSPPADPGSGMSASGTSASASGEAARPSTAHGGSSENQKRILIRGKTKGE